MLCHLPSDISFPFFVPALFTLKVIPAISTDRDLKVSAEAPWSKLGKSPEKLYNIKLLGGKCKIKTFTRPVPDSAAQNT